MITTIQPMNTKKLAGETTIGTGASKGICAALARLIRRRSVVDIIERFQTQHALQEEREMKNFHPLTNGAVDSGASYKNGAPGIARNKESSLPDGGMIVGSLRLSS
jgi:hypothetical protein